MKHLLIVIIWSLFVSFHDFHVTHTTIYYNADKESLEITVNVAIEDLERALEDQTAKKINIIVFYGSIHKNNDIYSIG